MKLKREMSVKTTGCSSLHFATLIHSKTISPSSAPDPLHLSHPKQTPITIARLGYVTKYVISSTVLNIFYRKRIEWFYAKGAYRIYSIKRPTSNKRPRWR